jgi:nucleoid-associated protein YgaU
MRKDPSDVTRELKLALIVGFALVLTVAILVSDHLSKARTANLATVGGTTKVVAKVPDSPIRSLDDLLPAQLPAAIEVVTPVATLTDPVSMPAESDPVQITAPVVIGQQQVAPSRDSKLVFAPGDGAGSLSASIRDHANTSATTPILGSSMVPPGSTPQDIVTREIKKTESSKPAPLAGEKTYTVASGDTLYAICRKQYGDANLFKKLAAANKMNENGGLKVGTTIMLPSKESLTGKPETARVETRPATKAQAKVEPKALKVEESKIKSYQVRPGDTLTNIAKKQLGSAGRSNEIASLNKMDPDDDLLAGAILKLPAR